MFVGRVLWCIIGLYLSMSIRAKCSVPKFPAGFKFGTATASYQVEGGWNASGKGENIWDHFTHNHPELVLDHSTGDVACDSYHLWKEDLKLLLDLNVDFYRFSLSWTRLLPTGFSNQINPDGVRYYNMIINDLIANKIEPVVTLYHWDLPQPLQELGGWTNPLIADYFEQYAEVAFDLFGDRVKTWITLNEPHSFCVAIYESGLGAPPVLSPGIGTYLCGKTVLLAHANAYHLYDTKFRSTQNGKVGITIDSVWAEPKTNSTEDIAAADREIQMSFGWWAHPIFSADGDYPEVMKERIANMSLAEGYPESRLPALTEDEIKYIQGTFDFFGLNHYKTWLVSNKEYPDYFTSFKKDKATQSELDPSWKDHDPQIVPWGLRKLLNWVKDQYGNPPVYITENGYPENAPVQDVNRILYLKGYIQATQDALLIDGCNIKGYTVWSLIDNMEWVFGYTMKFGMNHVDFNNPNRTRTPKASVDLYKNIIQTRVVPN